MMLIGFFIAALIGCLGLLYLLRWLIMRKGRAALRFAWSVSRSIKKAIVANPEVQQLVARHPLVIGWLGRRLSIRYFSGLPLTLLTVVFLYSLGLFVGLVESVSRNDATVAVDIRLANLLYVFRNPQLVRLFLWITLLGTWQTVLMVAASVTLFWWIRRRPAYIVPLWLAIVGSQMITFISKVSLHRPRPAGLVPVYVEPSFSFPSGHATLAVALYGFLAYYLIRSTARWKVKINTLFAGIAIVGAIGLSRLYLGVHFLSDVLSGSLVGLLWLIIAMSLVEWQRSRLTAKQFKPAASPRARRWSYVFLLLPLVWYLNSAWQMALPPTQAVAGAAPTERVEKSALVDSFAANSLPKFTETLTGHAQEPLSFIILAATDDQFITAFARAGWYQADTVSVAAIGRIIRAALLQQSYPTAPMTPSFWNSEVYEFGLEKPTDSNLVSERHHARFWRTSLRTTQGQTIYVGTASYDTSLKWFVTHRIQPDIDTERDRLLADLRAAGVVADYQQQQLVPPTLGKNFSGDEFFTDGKTDVVEIAL